MLGWSLSPAALPLWRCRRFSPAQLPGLRAWYDPADLATLWQDADMTVPVTETDTPVAAISDKGPLGLHLVQQQPDARPTYQSDGTRHWLQFDGKDDALKAHGPVPLSTLSICIAVAFEASAWPDGRGGIFGDGLGYGDMCGTQLAWTGDSQGALVVGLTWNEAGVRARSAPRPAPGTAQALALFTGAGAFFQADTVQAFPENALAPPSRALVLGNGAAGGYDNDPGHFPGRVYGAVYAECGRDGAERLIAWLAARAQE